MEAGRPAAGDDPDGEPVKASNNLEGGTEIPGKLPISPEKLESLCTKWQVRELSLFGSVLREDFAPSSDVDVLVSFDPEAAWSLWDLMDMKADLENLLGRPVDLVEKEALRNPWRKQEILGTSEVVYAA